MANAVRRIAQLMLQKYNVSRFVGAAGDFFGATYILVYISLFKIINNKSCQKHFSGKLAAQKLLKIKWLCGLVRALSVACIK